MLTPASILWRADSWNRTSFADMFTPNGLSLFRDDAHDVVFTHHEVLGAFDFHGLAGELAEQDAVADLDIQRAHLPVFEDLAFADGDDFALVRLLRNVIGNDDAACGFALLIETLHHNAVVQGTDFHHDVGSSKFNVWPLAIARPKRTGASEARRFGCDWPALPCCSHTSDLPAKAVRY